MQGVYTKETEVYFKGPAGQLQAQLFEQPSSPDGKIPLIGIICHPHPLFQGTMDNKVVTTIAKSWREMGLTTLRFNFRGVGKSEGAYGEGVGEVEDLKAIIEAIQATHPVARIWLAGFSFGSFIAFQVAQQDFFPVQALLSVAPPVHHFNFLAQVLPPCPWIILQGELDTLVPFEKVQCWFNTVKQQKFDAELLSFPNADHFFHGQLLELKDAILTRMRTLETSSSSHH